MNAVASIKALARDAVGFALSATGATAPSARLRERLSIITFHRVLTKAQQLEYALPGIAVTPEELDAHLNFAKRHFQCLPLTAALDRWSRPHQPGPPILAITFDDGQLDNHQNALPILDRHGVCATFFVPSQIIDDPRPLWHDALSTLIAQLTLQSGVRGDRPIGDEAGALLAELLATGPIALAPGRTEVESALESTKDWSPSRRKDWMQRAQKALPRWKRPEWDGFMTVAQMKDLMVRGHEVGSHSHSHPLLPQCTSEELQDEIDGSKRRLEHALGVPINTFCYPNGSTDHRSVERVRAAGFRAAVTTRWGSNQLGQDLHQLRRFDMSARHAEDRKGRFSAARLAWRMSGWHPGLANARLDPYAEASA